MKLFKDILAVLVVLSFAGLPLAMMFIQFGLITIPVVLVIALFMWAFMWALGRIADWEL